MYIWAFTVSDVCSQCNHVVANHEYTFKVEGEYQVSQ